MALLHNLKLKTDDILVFSLYIIPAALKTKNIQDAEESFWNYRGNTKDAPLVQKALKIQQIRNYLMKIDSASDYMEAKILFESIKLKQLFSVYCAALERMFYFAEDNEEKLCYIFNKAPEESVIKYRAFERLKELTENQ